MNPFNKAPLQQTAQHTDLSTSSTSALPALQALHWQGEKCPLHHPEGKRVTHSPTLDTAPLPGWLHHPHRVSDRLRFYQSIYRPAQSQLPEEPIAECRTNPNVRIMFRGAGDRQLMNHKETFTPSEIAQQTL